MRRFLYSKGSKDIARITVVDMVLKISPILSHPTHDTQHSEMRVNIAKHTFWWKAAKIDPSTKHMVAESVNGMSFDQQLRASLSQRYCRQPTCIISPWMPHSLHWQNLQRTGTLFNNSKWKDLKPASPSRWSLSLRSRKPSRCHDHENVDAESSWTLSCNGEEVWRTTATDHHNSYHVYLIWILLSSNLADDGVRDAGTRI